VAVESRYNCYYINIGTCPMQLESNIRGVAFSESWLKPIDDWHVVSPGVSVGASCPAAYLKRRADGRQHIKHSLASESGITI
jgi:hypothetical protein